MSKKSSTLTGSVASSTSKGPKKASTSLLKFVEKLLDKATKAPAKPHLQALSEDKLFEVLALAKLLAVFKRSSAGFKVTHIPPKATNAKSSDVVVAGGPASRNQKKFSHFDLFDAQSKKIAEAWVSLEVHSLSWNIAGKIMPVPHSARHELDVAIVNPGSSSYPNHDEIQVAVSCKNRGLSSKEQVREALGLRRETALLAPVNLNSRAPWLKPQVPCSPSSLMYLISSDAGIKKYRIPVDRLGVYVRYLHYDTTI